MPTETKVGPRETRVGPGRVIVKTRKEYEKLRRLGVPVEYRGLGWGTTGTVGKAVVTPQMAASRAGQISRENPSLSNAESLAAAMAEITYGTKVPSGGGRKATEVARSLAQAHLEESVAYRKAIAEGKSKAEAEKLGIEAVTGRFVSSAEVIAMAKTPEGFEQMLPKRQFDWLQKELGLIPKDAEFVMGDKLGTWSARLPTPRETKFETEHIELADGKWMLIEDWNKLPKQYQTIGLRQGFDTMQKAIEDDIASWRQADKVLTDKGYKTAEGYMVIPVLVSDDREAIAAIKTIFRDRPSVIKEAEAFIKKEGGIPEEWGKGTVPYKISELWRKTTPWKEEKLETVHTAVAKFIDESMARRKEVEQTYEAQGVTFPPDYMPPAFRKAMRNSAKFLDEKVLPKLNEYQEAWIKAIRKPDIWTRPDGTRYVKERNLLQEAFRGGIAGLGSIPIVLGTVGTTVGSSLFHGLAKDEKESQLMAATLVAGMADWMAGIPRRVVKDPRFETTYTIGIFAGAPVKAAWKIGKVAYKIPAVKLNPTRLSNSVVALQADIGRTALPPKMTEFAARDLVNAVEWAWGGKKAVPKELKSFSPAEQAMITAMLKDAGAPLKDVVIKTEAGKVVGHVTAFQRTVPGGAWHASPIIDVFAKDLVKKGYFESKPGVYGGYWLSQQPASGFMASGKLGEAGLVFHRLSPRDLMPIPPEVLRMPNFAMMKQAMEGLARAGKLKPGVYPLFKWYSKEMKYELELFAVGMKFRAIKPTWYTPERRYGTASLKTESLISYRELAREPAVLYSPKTGKPIIDPRTRQPKPNPKAGQLLLDPITKQPYFTGEAIRQGQTIPILIVASEKAIKDGFATVPKLSEMYRGEFIHSPIIAIRKWLAGTLPRKPATDYTIPTVSAKTISKYQPVTLKPPRKAVAEASATEFFKLRERELGFTDKDAMALGEKIDARGYVVKAREPYKHPDPNKLGLVRTRVTIIIRDPQTGAILLTKHLVEPKGTANLPGGQIDPVGSPRIRRYKDKITLEEAAREQILSELGIDIVNIQRVGLYRGKVTEYSMPGSYVFIADAKSTKLRVADPKEVIGWQWIKSGDKATTSFATLDILKSLGKDFNLSKVKTYGMTKYWGKWKDAPRDIAFSNRVLSSVREAREGKVLSEIIDQAEKVERKPTIAEVDKLTAMLEEWMIGTKARQQWILEYTKKNEAKLRTEMKAYFEARIKEGVEPAIAAVMTEKWITERVGLRFAKARVKEYSELQKRMKVIDKLEEAYRELPYRRIGGKYYPFFGISKEERVISPEAAALYEPIVREAIPEPLPEPKFEPRPEPTPEPRPEPVPEPKPEPVPEPVPKPVPKLVLEPVPEPVPIRPVPVPIGKPIDKERRISIPAGSIAWKQGMVWKYLSPPWTYEKPHTLWQPPIGALRTGDKTPKQTIQMIGKPRAKVPESASVDLGIADILITKSGREISFTGKGLETIVGHSIAEPTKGISIPATTAIRGTFKVVPKTKHKKPRAKTGSRKIEPMAAISTARMM